MNNKYFGDDELELRKGIKKSINEDNMVTKTVRDDSDLRELSNKSIQDYDTEFVRIPISLIRPRKYNGKILSEIEKLADSISSIGLLEPIIVIPEDGDDDKAYTVSAGHRRTKAYNMLYEKALEDNDPNRMELYSTIPARVLSKNEIDREEEVFIASNTYRVITVFERLLELNLTEDIFSDERIKKEYVTKKYGNNGWAQFKDGDIKVKFNNGDIKSYYTMKYLENNPTNEYSNETIGSYIDLLMKASEELVDEVLNANLSLRQFRKIAKFEKEIQSLILEQVGKSEDSIEEIIERYENISESNESNLKIKTDIDIINSCGKSLIKQLSNEEEFLNALGNKPKLNGNQKEYIKMIKKIFKNLKELNEMPTK